jgi:hypothetical protein
MLTQKFKDINLVRKIQVGFMLIACVSTIIAVSSYFQMAKTEKQKYELFNNFLQPENKIYEVYNRFKDIKFKMSKIASPTFSSSIDANMKYINQEKANVESAFKYFSTKEFDKEIKD